MSSVHGILILCGIALIAFFVNLRKKLPKSVFVFLVVGIVTCLCWHAMESGQSAAPRKEERTEIPVVFTEAAQDVVISPGETRIALSVLVSGKRSYDCVRFVMEAGTAAPTEQAFVDKVKFSLLFADGTLVPADGISIEKDGEFSFPRRFVLKVFFRASESPSKEMRCVIENGLGFSFNALEVSVGARPFSSESGLFSEQPR